MGRTSAFRRHQLYRHLNRRLSEDRNQHYNDLSCPCRHDPKAMARFKEQPKICSCDLCRNPRRSSWVKGLSRLTAQELRAL